MNLPDSNEWNWFSEIWKRWITISSLLSWASFIGINLRKPLFNFRSLLTTCLGRCRPSPLFVREALTLESREAAHHWPTFCGYYLGQWCARTWRGGCDLVIPGGHRWNRFRWNRVQFSHFEQQLIKKKMQCTFTFHSSLNGLQNSQWNALHCINT